METEAGREGSRSHNHWEPRGEERSLPTASLGSGPCWHLDPRLLGSGLGDQICCSKPPRWWSSVMAALGNEHPNGAGGGTFPGATPGGKVRASRPGAPLGWHGLGQEHDLDTHAPRLAETDLLFHHPWSWSRVSLTPSVLCSLLPEEVWASQKCCPKMAPSSI